MQATESKSKSKSEGKRKAKAPTVDAIGAVVTAVAIATDQEPCPIPTADQLGQLDTSSLGQLAGAEYAAGEYLRTVHWLRAGAYAAEYVRRWVAKGYERKEATRDVESAIRMSCGCQADVHVLIQAYHVWRLLGFQGGGWMHPGKLPWSGFKALLPLAQRADPGKEEWAFNAKVDADEARGLFLDWAVPKDGQRMPVDVLQQRVDQLLGRATGTAKPDGEKPPVAAEPAKPDGEKPPVVTPPVVTPPVVTPPPAAEPVEPSSEPDEEDGESDYAGVASVLPAGETNAADPRAHLARAYRAGTVADAAALVCDLLCERDDADSVLVSLIRDHYGLTPTVAVQLVQAILIGAGPETRNQVYQLIAGQSNGRRAG